MGSGASPELEAAKDSAVLTLKVCQDRWSDMRTLVEKFPDAIMRYPMTQARFKHQIESISNASNDILEQLAKANGGDPSSLENVTRDARSLLKTDTGSHPKKLLVLVKEIIDNGHHMNDPQLMRLVNWMLTLAEDACDLDPSDVIKRDINSRVAYFFDAMDGGHQGSARVEFQITGGTFYGPVVNRLNAEEIRDSFQSVPGLRADIRSGIERLLSAVEALVVDVEETEAKKLASTLKTFTREAAKSEPDHQILAESSQTLLDVGSGKPGFAALIGALEQALNLLGVP